MSMLSDKCTFFIRMDRTKSCLELVVKFYTMSIKDTTRSIKRHHISIKAKYLYKEGNQIRDEQENIETLHRSHTMGIIHCRRSIFKQSPARRSRIASFYILVFFVYPIDHGLPTGDILS